MKHLLGTACLSFVVACSQADRREDDAGARGDSGGADFSANAPIDAGSMGCGFPGEREHPHDSAAATHIGQPLDASEYNSDPPSSGPHCPVWGAYAVFTEEAPLPPCNYIHNLEHGAIVLLYNCPEGCRDLVSALTALHADPPPDPDCATARVLLTPYGGMEARVAAVAWGYTWTSNCFDEAALREFMSAHMGSRGDAPEPSVCEAGSVPP